VYVRGILPSVLFTLEEGVLTPCQSFPVTANSKLAVDLLTAVASNSVKWIITPKCVGLCIRLLTS